MITGWISSKKNTLKLTKFGHGYYPTEVRENLNEINQQVASQWIGMEPLIHPAMAVVFYTRTGRSDRDNKLTTVLDCLVASKVLKDDNIENFNSPVLIGKAYKQGTEGLAGARIFLEPSGDFDRLWSYMKTLDLADVTPVREYGASLRSCEKHVFRGRRETSASESRV